MGVVAETAQRVVVMYASQQVEEQAAEQLFAQPRHPYTRRCSRLCRNAASAGAA
jgi:ABC-type dipeptide/oligopeptide/nickel transport system ATPase component